MARALANLLQQSPAHEPPTLSPERPPRARSQPGTPQRPRGRPRGSFKKKPETPPVPAKKSQAPRGRRDQPSGRRKLPLLLKFVSKAKRLKPGQAALARARRQPSSTRRSTPKRYRPAPAPAPEDTEEAAAPGKRRRQGRGEPEKEREVSPDPPSIAQSTRAQCLKRGRGRPPLTPTQRAERGVPGAEDPPGHKTTFLKNIRQFIMPVVSARSSRLIRTPRRFMDEPHSPTPALPRPPPEPEPVEEPSPQAPAPPRSPTVADSSPASSPPVSPVPSPPASPAPPAPGQRRAILREPTFRWTSLSAACPPAPPKRSPLLRAPQFTPSEAHLKIYESLGVAGGELEAPPAPPTPEAPRPPSPAPDEPVMTRSGRRLLPRTNHLSLPLFPREAPKGQPPGHDPAPPQLVGMDKVYSLLTRAKVQLFKIDQQQQQLKAAPVRAGWRPRRLGFLWLWDGSGVREERHGA